MLSDLLIRARALFRRGAMEQDLDDELQAHLEVETARHLRRPIFHLAADGRSLFGRKCAIQRALRGGAIEPGFALLARLQGGGVDVAFESRQRLI